MITTQCGIFFFFVFLVCPICVRKSYYCHQLLPELLVSDWYALRVFPECSLCIPPPSLCRPYAPYICYWYFLCVFHVKNQTYGHTHFEILHLVKEPI